MTARICRYTDVAAFIARAASWLLRAEAEHNLILGLLAQLQRGEVNMTAPPYLAVVEVDGAIVGCALRTPPHKLIITRMPQQAIPALVADTGACMPDLWSVLGPEPVAREFGRHWARQHGTRAVDGTRQRLYVLRQLRQPPRPAPGVLLLATPEDEALVVRWIERFADEAGMRQVDAARHARHRIMVGDIALWWNDGNVCSMAGVSGRSRSCSRIGYVYTPPPMRARGYATACVAELTRRELGMGAAFCCLFTDLTNFTSNHIYQQIGYEPVCDFSDILFGER